MHELSYKIINGVTVYRIIAAPVMLALIFTGHQSVFKWLLPVSFLTDAIDGYLARKYKVTSIIGARLDSIGDDLTVLVATIGLLVFKFELLKNETIIIGILLTLWIIQNLLAFIRYRKASSFHTYMAKAAAVLQGIFFILTFFYQEPLYVIFYVACIITILDLMEEIFLVLFLPQWEINVKGLYWVLRRDQPNDKEQTR